MLRRKGNCCKNTTLNLCAAFDHQIRCQVFKGRLFAVQVRLAEGFPPNRNPRPVNALRITADQRVPISQSAALMDPSIGAGERHPGQSLHILRRQLNAIWDMRFSVCIVRTLTGLGVEQAAMHPCRHDIAGVLVFKSNEAAKTASVAELLPLAIRHLVEAFCFPKRSFDHAMDGLAQIHCICPALLFDYD